ncbi:hypothetical protein RN001_000587 [Aquatica leii]|uniref:Receptor expression-enhancing protein n=1 Tax=Aquatica leii TaxID=1421715 RepID=A0AAN7PMG8_9COLE|nr:hypothetical protein RN001_000587 [Aquatica leii]
MYLRAKHFCNKSILNTISMSHDLLELKDKVIKQLYDESKPWTKLLKSVEQATGIDRQYLFYSFLVLVLLWLGVGYAGQLVCNFIGIAYPAYASIGAIESKDSLDDTKWLTYWVVFSSFSFIEYFASTIVGWFPFYWLFKCLFFTWLMVPIKANGSIVLYNYIIKPYFMQYHEIVDEAILQAQSTASEILESAKKKDR